MAKKKSTKEKKTNDERILDQHHIEYEEVSFDWINNGADALAEAKEQGVPAESILKTIVMQANNDAKRANDIAWHIEDLNHRGLKVKGIAVVKTDDGRRTEWDEASGKLVKVEKTSVWVAVVTYE